MTDLLQVSNLTVRYAGALAVDQVEIVVPHRGAVALLGANGAGKSSALKAIGGLVEASGSIILNGQDVSRLSSRKRVELGIVYVPEGRELVLSLTVDENLTLGAYFLDARARRSRRDAMLALFPEIAPKLRSPAWTLSGGEQQMLAIGRGLMASPRVLLVDEPSLGLAPLLTRRVFERLGEIRAVSDFAVLVVEQNFNVALRLVDSVYFMRNGRIVGRRDSGDLRSSKSRTEALEAYLGDGRSTSAFA